MTDPTIHNKHLQKLHSLRKNKPHRKPFKIGVGGLFTKWFFTIVTVLVMGGLLVGTVFSRVTLSTQLATTNATYLTDLLEDFIDATTDIEDDIFTEIEAAVFEITQPINSILLSDWLVEWELGRARELLEEWKGIISPLQKYSLTAGGFRAGPNDATFSSALQTFFNQMGRVLDDTSDYWDSLILYKFLAGFNSQTRTLMHQIESVLTLLRELHTNQNKILNILGHYFTQEIVIFNQNPGEARPTGGFIGSYLVMSISQGELEVRESQSIYWASGSTPTALVGHPISWFYGSRHRKVGPAGLHNMNYFSCFSESAKLLAQEFEKSRNGFTINQLYMVTPNLLDSVLPDDFIIDVPEIGALNKANLINQIEVITGISIEDDANPKKDIKPIFEALFNSFGTILESLGSRGLVVELVRAVQTRSLQFWYPSSDTVNFFNDLGLSSDQVCHTKNSNIISPYIFNIASDKRHLITEYQYAISSARIWGGHRITVNMRQDLNSVQFLQRGFNDRGRNFLGFQIPGRAQNITFDSTPSKVHPALRRFYEVNIENNSSRPVEYPPQTTRIINSAQDIENGVVYQNPDGSLVVGAIVQDLEGVSTATISFDITMDNFDSMSFFPQPGQNITSLNLGDGVLYLENRNLRSVSGYDLFKGAELMLK